MTKINGRVVITGMGTLNPLGNDVQTTWENAKNGKSGITTITQFDASAYKTQIAGEVKDFDADALFGRREARRMSRLTQLGLAAAGQAITNAGLEITDSNRDRIGVLMGSGMGSLDPISDNVTTLTERGPNRVSPFFVPMMLADTPSAMISITYGLRGPNMVIYTACAAANDAIGQAASHIQRGATDVMITGGAESCVLPIAIAGFGAMKAISTRNDQPETASRPFDVDRDGFIVAEGAGVLVLESLDHAQARGATIYGELLGYGSSSDAYHISTPLEQGQGAVNSMQAALNDAGLASTAVDYINAHGTSTALNDSAETAAIKTVFGDAAYHLPISSTKSMHGHMLGATGAVEAIISLQAIADNVAPPTINYSTPDPTCDLDYVPNMARDVDINTVMSNTFGLGGHNATLILGKFA